MLLFFSAPKRKRFYKSESIPSQIKREKSEDLYQELARKKIQLLDFQMKLLTEEAERKEEEAERKEKRLAEKHDLEMKILLAELKNKDKL